MEIGYAQVGGVGQEFNSLLNSLREKTKILFEDKFYGEDLFELVVGIVCVAPEFDQFFKVGKSKYQKERKEYIEEGVKYVLDRSFEYSIKLDYQLYRTLKGEELKENLFREIFNSFEIFNSPAIKKKIKDFDREAFFKDLDILKLQTLKN
jgi:hypothetical protein